MTRYEVLHYRGDLTLDVREGQILGCDEVGRPYMTTDAEYDASTDTTTVFLEYASTEALRAAGATA